MSDLEIQKHEKRDSDLPGDDDVSERTTTMPFPIDWPGWVKALVLFQVVTHAAMSSWCAAAFIPAFPILAVVFHRSITEISYLVGAYTLLLGFGLLLWNPVSEAIGRRPVMLIALVVAIASACGVAKAETYGGIMAARVFLGLGMAAPCGLGAAYIKDMYDPANRGKALGLWTLGLTTGPFLSPLVGGFITQYSNYEWIMWIQAILLAGVLVLEIFLLPESLVSAPGYRAITSANPGALLFQLPWGGSPVVDEKSPGPMDSVVKTLKAVAYPPAWLAGLAFAVPYGYIAVSMSSLFPIVYGLGYHFAPGYQGLLYLPMLIGSVLAEAVTGSLGDYFVNRGARNGKRTPEHRLPVAFIGCLFALAGLLWFGEAVEKKQHWASPAVATGFAAFGAQMMTSICFSYIIDCAPKSAKEVALIMNIFRVLSSFVVLFYNQQLVGAVGYGWGFGVQCFITIFFSIGGLLILQIWGKQLR